ncbi:DUF6444 domain-containing protein [Endozoicomonas ascidiicola]|uniref:DUF6444 domain-containing protein n=1 Tax=Endozoicomonas ascidiicola TaxID=1698521 RepID=UPI00082E85CC|nr:DUF6444 domain-containing protein [Endozoicomonas ascidiicola]
MKVACLAERCRNLEEMANKNSQNSSKPPLSDGCQKSSKNSNCENESPVDENSDSSTDTPNPKSLRQPSGNKPGGQKGHQGSYLKQVDNPDYIKCYKVNECHYCQARL